MKGLRLVLIVAAIVMGLWLILESGMRLYVERPLERDFYGSVTRDEVRIYQEQIGVQVATGPGWVHLGWIADPERESYCVEWESDDGWLEVGRADYGSYLLRDEGGRYRVWAVPAEDGVERLLGEVTAVIEPGEPPLFVPRIDGPWQYLYQPHVHGYYVNDHSIYRDAQGGWRLVGITDKSEGNFNNEMFFTVAVSEDFPPARGMGEVDPVADYGALAWAPHVLREGETYYMFWSPHKLHRMTSPDGIHWEDHQIVMSAPFHKFFRDPMVLKVSEGQWLLYTTARGAYFSQVDIYQSFDLHGWQYIRTALSSSWGSERNSPFSSMESPFVTAYQGRYYLSLTYNNDSYFWPGILLTFKIWPNPDSYNETMVFHADNPYDFGTYQGHERTPNLIANLETHAPEIVNVPELGAWYITTAGWPWVATLTSGEVAVAPLHWDPVP